MRPWSLSGSMTSHFALSDADEFPDQSMVKGFADVRWPEVGASTRYAASSRSSGSS